MHGTIQYINSAQHNGILEGDDGTRWGFTLFDCAPGTHLCVGSNVNFNIQDGVAIEIRKINTVAPTNQNLREWRLSLQSEAGNVAHADVKMRESHYTPAQSHFAANDAANARPSSRLIRGWTGRLAALALILIVCLASSVSYFVSTKNILGVISSANATINSLSPSLNNLQHLVFTKVGVSTLPPASLSQPREGEIGGRNPVLGELADTNVARRVTPTVEDKTVGDRKNEPTVPPENASVAAADSLGSSDDRRLQVNSAASTLSVPTPVNSSTPAEIRDVAAGNQGPASGAVNIASRIQPTAPIILDWSPDVRLRRPSGA